MRYVVAFLGGAFYAATLWWLLASGVLDWTSAKDWMLFIVVHLVFLLLAVIIIFMAAFHY